MSAFVPPASDSPLPAVGVTLEGDDTANTLVGGGDDDTIRGKGGNDVLDGRGGDDRMEGGAGDDIYFVEDQGDTVVELANEGTDEVRSSLASYTLTANVENLRLFGGAIEGHGNSLNNTITGNDLGNVFTGGGGSDVFAGGEGDDVYHVDAIVTELPDGGRSISELDQTVELPGQGHDVVWTNAGGTIMANVEDMYLTGSADLSVFGNELGNGIVGNSGDNFLRGGGGDDFIDGGEGADTMGGGDGNDTYFVDNAGDRIEIESPEEGQIDTVYSSIDWTLDFGLENLFLTGADNLRGTGNGRNNFILGNAGDNIIFGDAGNDIIDGAMGADTLRGGFGGDILTDGEGLDDDFLFGEGDNDILIASMGNDLLDGGFGMDQMRGGTGNDIYVVGQIGDVVEELAGEGDDTVQASISYTLGANVERLTLTGSVAINGTGNALANVITGNDGNNELNGGDGDDVLIGGRGVDRLTGGAGADRFVFTSFEDSSSLPSDNIIGFEAGVDRIDLSALGTVQLTIEQLNDASTGPYWFVTAEGNGGALFLRVYSAQPVTEADFIVAVPPAPTGPASNGDDVLHGDDGPNSLYGLAGNDRIYGFGGDDNLIGGAGSDFLEGGAGSDIYYIDGQDTIGQESVLDAGFDTVYTTATFGIHDNRGIEALFAADGKSTDPITLVGNDRNNIIQGNDGHNALYGGAGDDSIRGFGGNDVMDGQAGTDYLIGGLGDDIYYVDGLDTAEEAAGEGYDTVYASTSYVLNFSSEIEMLATTDHLSTAMISLSGNQLNNYIVGNNGDNIIDGRTGDDSLLGLAGNDLMIGGSGVDYMIGGLGDDNYYVDYGDSVIEDADGGFDAVYSATSYVLTAGSHVEVLGTLDHGSIAALDLTGNALNQSIIGSAGANLLRGLGGNDSLNGLGGDDRIDGGAGQDVLEGGDGADMFVFSAASDSAVGAGDIISLFFSGTDKIDLSAIDANSATAADDAFTFVGANAFSGVAGQLRVEAGNGVWTVTGDVNGDSVADFSITVYGQAPVASDFVV